MAEATRRRAAGGLVVVCAAQFVIGVDGLAAAALAGLGAVGAWQLHGRPAGRGG